MYSKLLQNSLYNQQSFMLMLMGVQVSSGLADLDWAWLDSPDSAVSSDLDPGYGLSSNLHEYSLWGKG